jgi:hypothetical protein
VTSLLAFPLVLKTFGDGASRQALLINAAAYPHPALRATFSRTQEKGWFVRLAMALMEATACPFSRLREKVGMRVTL